MADVKTVLNFLAIHFDETFLFIPHFISVESFKVQESFKVLTSFGNNNNFKVI